MPDLFAKHLIVLFVVMLGGATANADERYDPIRNETVAKECGACHMAFQPQMLPRKSWTKLMSGLTDHFGEDASLDDATIKVIAKYLDDNAADSGWIGGKFMRGLSDNSAPLRITLTPYWVREHNEEVPERSWNDPKVKSKANCPACHRRADKGDYDDD